MAPDVAPIKHVSHRDHRNSEASGKGLLADHGEAAESQTRKDDSVFKATHLVLGNPKFEVLEIDLGRG